MHCMFRSLSARRPDFVMVGMMTSLAVGVMACGGDSTEPNGTAEPIPDRVYAIVLSNATNSCGAQNPGRFQGFVEPKRTNSGYSVLGVNAGSTPAVVAGDRLTLSTASAVNNATVKLTADWTFAAERHTFQGKTVYDVTQAGGKACTFTFATTGTHDLSKDAPPQATSASPLAAPDLEVAAGRGATGASGAPPVAVNSLRSDPVSGVPLPAHDYYATCYPYGNQYVIVATPTSFGAWPNAGIWLMNLGGSTTVNDGEYLLFGLTAAWNPANAPSTWAYSGAFLNQNSSWMRGFNDILTFTSQEWLNGGWQQIPPERALQVSAVVPGRGTYWVGGSFYWGPIASMSFAGYYHHQWKYRVTCG